MITEVSGGLGVVLGVGGGVGVARHTFLGIKLGLVTEMGRHDYARLTPSERLPSVTAVTAPGETGVRWPAHPRASRPGSVVAGS